jgi:hypothetical protein
MVSLFRKIDIRATIVAGIIEGMVFAVPVYFFIREAKYQDTWLLYLGSFLFLGAIFIYVYRDTRKRSVSESTLSLVFSSHMATLAGILVSCILSFLLLAIFVPGYLGASSPAESLESAPVNTIHDRTNGLSFKIFIAATFINFSVGSFTSILIPFAAKRNQTKDRKDPAPLHQRDAG